LVLAGPPSKAKINTNGGLKMLGGFN